MLTHEILKEALDYCAETGVFRWKFRPENHFCNQHRQKLFNSRYAGKIAGSILLCHSDIKYLRISFNKRLYLAHRLAWFWFYGYWPQDQIDHIDHNGLNNKIDNLRCVNNTQNTRNASLPKNNTSGVIGVGWHKENQKWTAQISANSKQIFLGIFDEKSEAIRARQLAEEKYGYYVNHGTEKSTHER